MLIAFTITLAFASALYLIACARREWRTRGRLSARTSAGVWALSLTYMALVVLAAWYYGGQLPVNTVVAFATGSALLLGGVWLYGAGVIAFRSFEQVSGTETGELVTGGIYRRSRNPQVLGWSLVLLGVAVTGRSLAALVLMILFLAIWHVAVKAEEEHLERTFGEQYRKYRSATPRYL